MTTKYYLAQRSSPISAFVSGMGRAIDIGATLNARGLYSDSNISPEEADFIALKSDWQKVGDDLISAIKEYEHAR